MVMAIRTVLLCEVILSRACSTRIVRTYPMMLSRIDTTYIHRSEVLMHYKHSPFESMWWTIRNLLGKGRDPRPAKDVARSGGIFFDIAVYPDLIRGGYSMQWYELFFVYVCMNASWSVWINSSPSRRPDVIVSGHHGWCHNMAGAIMALVRVRKKYGRDCPGLIQIVVRNMTYYP